MPILLSWVALLSLAFVGAGAASDLSMNRVQNNMRHLRSLSAIYHRHHNYRGLNTALFVSQPSWKQPSTPANRISLSNRFSISSPLLRAASLTTMESDHTAYSQSIPSITEELNDAQKEATLRPRYSITRVIAGPGAGKTKVLTCRIAHLLLDKSNQLNDDDADSSHHWEGRDREGILAVTFTKKSAMEMERRLTDLLSSATTTMQEVDSSSDYDATSAISTGEDDMEEGEFVQYGNADPDDHENDDARQLMRQTMVGTFHSVSSKILRKFGNELGNLPSVRNCLGVTNASGATVVQEGIQTEAPGYDEEQSIANELLIQTLDGSFNILDQSDQLRLLKEILQKFNIVLKDPSAASSGGGSNDIRPNTILNAISLLNTNEAAKITSPGGKGDDDLSNKIGRKVLKIATAIRVPFQKAKYSQNSVDFDDLILLTRELLLYHPEVREVLHRRWRHILVDEFQDTSQIQLDLVRLLTTNSLFAVGDGDQSIYSWRGASPESMSDFEVAFHDRTHGWEGLLNNHDGNLSQYLERISGEDVQDSLLKVKSVYLMENYRSTTNIVKAAQRIISTGEKSDKKDAQDNIRRDMKPMRGTGPPPRVLACKDARAEAKFVVKTVNSMIDSGDLTPSSTVAMIYRTNAQSRLLEEACVENNLRYVVRGSSGTFYKRAEIQDCMSFLKIMYNDRDRSAWARAVKAPSRGIGAVSLNEFFNYCDAVTEKYLETANSRDDLPTPMDVLMSLAPAGDAIEMLIPPKDIMSNRSINKFIPFASSLSSLRRKAEVQGVPDFLLSLIEDLGLKGHFDTISKTRDEYEDRLGNVMELVRAAERYKDDGPCISPVLGDGESTETPLGNFLDDVALIADLAPDESDSEGASRVVANLLTIHSSKGMEFDAVFLVGNEDGTLPTQKAIGEGEGSIELSEERRLCYVAMTRAKTHLVLTWRREVSYFAGATFRTRDAIRSRFLDILVSKKGDKSSKAGSKPNAQGRSNNISARKGTFSRGQGLGSMTKRELHSEADRYLASNRGRIPASSQTMNQSIDRRQIEPSIHSQANRYSSSGSKSWDDWEPTSQKNPIKKIPSIEPHTPGRAIDRRQIMPSSQPQKRPMHSSSDRRQVMPSAQNQSRQEQVNSNRARIPASSQTINQSIDRRQIQPSPRTVTQNRDVPKRPSQTTRPKSTPQDNNGATLRSEPPPQMDSTMFYPVGSPVKHNLHGRGIVQTPPNADEQFAERMLVRVKFVEESMEWDLPMDGLVHTYE